MRLLLIICLLPLRLCAQDVTGIWTGFLHTTGNDLPYELVISGNSETLTGYSLTVFTFNGIDNIGVKSIKLKKKNRNLSLEDDEMIYNNYSTPPKRIKLYGDLFLKIEDTVMILTGTFSTRTLDLRAQDKTPFLGTIELKKQNPFIATKLIAKLDELNLLNSLSFVAPTAHKKEEVAAVAVVAEDSERPPLKEKKTAITAAPSLSKQETAIASKPEALMPSTLTQTAPDPAPPQIEKEKQIQPASGAITTGTNPARPNLVKTTILPPSTLTQAEPEPVLTEKEKQTSVGAVAATAQKPTSPNLIKPGGPAPSTLTRTEPTPLPPQVEREKKISAGPGMASAGEKTNSTTLSKPETPSTITAAKPEPLPPQVEKERRVTAPGQTVGIIVSSTTPTLQKKTTPEIPAVVSSKMVAPPAAALAERKTEIIRSVSFTSDSLVLSLYDNGEVDGDTVSVVLNGKVIIAQQGLTTKAIRTTIYITPEMGDSLQLIMYAENLGRIPPNTGLLLVQDGDQRIDIRFAGDMQKSSAVIFRRKR